MDPNSGIPTEPMPGPSNGEIPAASSSSAAVSTCSFECSVCLGDLDKPASIDTPVRADSEENDFVGMHFQRNMAAIAPPRGNNNRGAAGRGRGSSSRGRARIVMSITTPTDIAATPCGHIYHQMCVEKWFVQENKRLCPLCRTTMGKKKLLRLYPNASVNRERAGHIPTTGFLSGPRVTEDSDEDGDEECGRPECQYQLVIHNTLINDFNDLQERYNQVRETAELKEAQVQSLEEDNARKDEEIMQLKRQLERASAAALPTPPASKRGRRN